MIGATANAIVRLMRAGHRQQMWLSVAGLVLTLVLATAYLLVGALRVAPFAIVLSGHRAVAGIRWTAAQSGCRAARCAHRTCPVAAAHRRRCECRRQHHLEGEDPGVQRRTRVGPVCRRRAIPKLRSRIRRRTVSARRQRHRTRPRPPSRSAWHSCSPTPTECWRRSIPHKIELIKKELSLTKQGPAKLAAIVDGGTFLLSTLDSVLPETTSIIKTSRVVLTLASRQERRPGRCRPRNSIGPWPAWPECRAATAAWSEQTPHSLSAVDSIFADNSDTMVQLLGSVATMCAAALPAGAGAQRAFPRLPRVAVGRAGQHHSRPRHLGDGRLYPRYVCDYGTPAYPLLRRRLPRAFHVYLLPRRRPRGLDPRSQERAAAWRRRHRRPATGSGPGTQNRSDTEGPLHNSHPLRRPGSADRTAALKTKPV